MSPLQSVYGHAKVTLDTESTCDHIHEGDIVRLFASVHQHPKDGLKLRSAGECGKSVAVCGQNQNNSKATERKNRKLLQDECLTVYSRCGGQGYTGPTCCQEGSTCVVSNEWYSQCRYAPSPQQCMACIPCQGRIKL